MFLLILCISVLLLSAGDGRASTSTFVIAYISLVFSMMVLSTISMDHTEQGMAYLLTLPVSKQLYVLEKYICAGILLAVGWLIGLLECFIASLFIPSSTGFYEILIAAVSFLGIMLVASCITIPIQIRFGSDNGRLVVPSLIGLILIFAFAGTYILKKAGINTDLLLSDTMGFLHENTLILTLVALALMVIAVLASMKVSIRMLEKKEF